MNITIKINGEFTIYTALFFDTNAHLNCIREGLIRTKYFHKTVESLKSATKDQLRIK